MKYAIVGSGKIGTALARVFARKNIEVAIANSRGPETLAPLAKELGASIVPKSLVSATGAEIIFLAVPFSAHKEIAAQLPRWHGKIVVDASNAFHVAPGELGKRLSSEIVAEAFTGARVVKAFNHLPAQQLGANADVEGQRQVVFLSSNDADASTPSRHLRLSSDLLRSSSAGSMRVGCRCMLWTESLADFCCRT